MQGISGNTAIFDESPDCYSWLWRICRIQNADIPLAGRGEAAPSRSRWRSSTLYSLRRSRMKGFRFFACEERKQGDFDLRRRRTKIGGSTIFGLEYSTICEEPFHILEDPQLSIPKPGYTTGGSGRGGARRSGGAGRGRAGRDADGPVRPGDDRPLCPQASKTTVLNVSSEARTKEILCKPMEEQSPRLTRVLSVGPRALFVLGC